MTEFLLDENVLGLDRFLEGHVKYRKIGDEGCPIKGSTDPEVAKFALDNNLVIVTIDDKLIKQCKLLDIPFVSMDITELAKKVIKF